MKIEKWEFPKYFDQMRNNVRKFVVLDGWTIEGMCIVSRRSTVFSYSDLWMPDTKVLALKTLWDCFLLSSRSSYSELRCIWWKTYKRSKSRLSSWRKCYLKILVIELLPGLQKPKALCGMPIQHIDRNPCVNLGSALHKIWGARGQCMISANSSRITFFNFALLESYMLFHS